jgi:hypothetical protein
VSEALIGVIIGGLLLPVTQGIGFLVDRYFKQQDEANETRRDALLALQAAIVDLVSAEQAMIRADDRGRRDADARQAIATRKIRLLAAQINDEKLWELVHTPNPNRVHEVFQEHHPGEPGDMYDAWNGRIRELFHETKKPRPGFTFSKSASPTPAAAPLPGQPTAPADTPPSKSDSAPTL